MPNVVINLLKVSVNYPITQQTYHDDMLLGMEVKCENMKKQDVRVLSYISYPMNTFTKYISSA